MGNPAIDNLASQYEQFYTVMDKFDLKEKEIRSIVAGEYSVTETKPVSDQEKKDYG